MASRIPNLDSKQINQPSQGLIVQFAKAPILGKVKTRMAGLLTREQSVSLHCDLLQHTRQTLQGIVGVEYVLAIASSGHPYWYHQAFSSTQFWPQPEGDLGRRMKACFESHLRHSQRPWLILIGSDCPAIDADYIGAAIAALNAGERLVLGPATDGGYVLIAMPSPLAVFQGVDWGSDQVLAQTSANAHILGLTPYMLESLPDIDWPRDLVHLRRFPHLCHWGEIFR